ncbi:MAG: glycosyltransferase family 39 protein [Thermoflexales bacterium]|nr:glycosyltransferase family 39 protein [Thermoflexales bacterium]
MRSMLVKRRQKLVQLLVWLAILLLATFLRFYHLDWTEYKLDEANISRLALDMVRYGKVPVWGLGSSVGIYNGALSEWLLAIPYALSSNPLVATGFVAAFNVLAVAMTYAFTRKLAGPRAAWMATLLFAVAPWAVINSRKLWAQDLLGPFVIAYVWTAYLAFIEKKPWWLVVHALALSACIQLHYSALTLVFLSAFYVLVFWWRRWPWKVLLTTVAAGLLSMGPFLYLDAITIAPDMMTGQPHAFPNVTRIVQTVLYRKAVVDATAFQMAWIMTTGHDLHSLAGPQEFRNFLDSTLPLGPVLTGLGLLVTAAWGWALWWAVRRWRAASQRDSKPARAGFLVAMGVVFPILLFVWHSTPVYPHYLILLYPWPFVLVGMLIDWLAERRPAWRVGLWGGTLVVVIAAAQVYNYLAITHFVVGRDTPGGYGTPAGQTLRAVKSAEQVARELGGSIVVMADGDNVEADNIASIWDVLVDPAFDPRVVDRRSAGMYPDGPAVVVYAPGGSAGTPDVIRLSLRPGEGEYELFKWQGIAKSQLSEFQVPEMGRWANGVHLLGTDDSHELRPGQTFEWWIFWRVTSPPPPGADYHWFNHLVDAEGKRVGQADGVGFPARSWRVGDIVMTWFEVPIAPDAAPGTYTMRVGMYTYPDIQNVPVVDEAGNPVSDAVEVGPLEIVPAERE